MKCSIIIPTYNNAFLLEKALNSLLIQDFPNDKYEIIVIDNGSVDNTKQLVIHYINAFSQHNIRYFYDSVPGLLTGRHRGAKEAKANILVFIDEDIEASVSWLSSIYESFKDPNVHLVGGKCLPLYDSEVPEWEKSLWIETLDYKVNYYYSLIDQGEQIKDCSPELIFGLNFSIRKETLYKLGGFHPDAIPAQYMKFQGDGETGLSFKLKKNNLRAIYNPNATVYHHVTSGRLTMEYLEKRQYYQGVCDSYTSIRKNGIGLIDATQNVRPFIFIRRFTKKLLRLFFAKENKVPIDIKVLNIRIKAAYKRGFLFHQNEVKRDKELLEWIKRDNYLDYKLPKLK